jgi:nicotinate-nucleotide adenylyltransferase
MIGKEKRGRRLGILGGSFDPIHLGHLMLAREAFDAMRLEKVIFVPTALSPLKETIPGITDRDRLDLLEAAVGEDQRFEISTVELDRGGVSYTIDTVGFLSAVHPESRLFWIIGADQAASLNEWHRIDELAMLVEFIVLERPGFSWGPSDLSPDIRVHPIASSLLEISSSEIRCLAREGLTLKNLVPEEVASLITERQLYR